MLNGVFEKLSFKMKFKDDICPPYFFPKVYSDLLFLSFQIYNSISCKG